MTAHREVPLAIDSEPNESYLDYQSSGYLRAEARVRCGYSYLTCADVYHCSLSEFVPTELPVSNRRYSDGLAEDSGGMASA